MSSRLCKVLFAAASVVSLAGLLGGCGMGDGQQVLALGSPTPAPKVAEDDQIDRVPPTAPIEKTSLEPSDGPKPITPATFNPKFDALYQPMTDKFSVPGVPSSVVRKGFERTEVSYATKEPPGTIVIDPHAHYLYFIEPDGKAKRYGVAVGKEGFAWSGEATINVKREWPDWYPPKEMIERHPELKPQLDQLQSGMGVAGGYRNPLGARAMYLYQGNKDTYFRIHGTLEPHSIGTNASSGCIRLINQDAIDLYSRVPEGTRVVVLGHAQPTASLPKIAKKPLALADGTKKG